MNLVNALLAMLAGLSAALALASPRLTDSQSSVPVVSVLTPDGALLTSLVDGNRAQLRVTLASALDASSDVTFSLAGIDTTIAVCSVPAGQRQCDSAPFSTLGWHWNPDGSAQPQRVINASAGNRVIASSSPIAVKPRPLVMAHGFNSSWETWAAYLGPNSFLAPLGIPGYAVGDGQMPGVMDTGNMTRPMSRTHTIAENAAILGQYIAAVRQATGAEKVDLLVHSMGGMISRYYIDRVMPADDVAQLIILGTPMAGTACAVLPASLGVLLPATLEIQPSYMTGVFNRQVTRRHGVAFHGLAGTRILQSVQSPCSDVPSDLIVSSASVRAIPMPVKEMALLHTDLTAAPVVFEQFVAPLLRTAPGGFAESNEAAAAPTPAALQYTRVFTGRVAPGETATVTIPIDAGVAMANFALFDTTRSLTTTVTGASGRVIALNAQTHGVVQVTDPESLVYLGYGFAQPRPGLWRVAISATPLTPAEGADFAITAQFRGGATLDALAVPITPEVGATVRLTATLSANGAPLGLNQASALLRKPDGSSQPVALSIAGGVATANIPATEPGIHGLSIAAAGVAADGMSIDRGAFEVQPSAAAVALAQSSLNTGLLAGAAALSFAVVGAILLALRKRARR
jgi:pimeloyl-ACP methyl ester carboxylesterase